MEKQPSVAKGHKLVWIPQIVNFFITLFPAPVKAESDSDEDSTDDDIPTELKKISLTTSFRQPKVNHLMDLNQKMSFTKEKLPLEQVQAKCDQLIASTWNEVALHVGLDVLLRL